MYLWTLRNVKFLTSYILLQTYDSRAAVASVCLPADWPSPPAPETPARHEACARRPAPYALQPHGIYGSYAAAPQPTLPSPGKYKDHWLVSRSFSTSLNILFLYFFTLRVYIFSVKQAWKTLLHLKDYFIDTSIKLYKSLFYTISFLWVVKYEYSVNSLHRNSSLLTYSIC